MDIRMPNLDGIEATRRIAAGDGSPRVLILTTFDLDARFFFCRISRPNLNFNFFGRALAYHQIIGAFHVLDDRLIQFVASHTHAAAENDPGKGDQRDFGRASADVDNHIAGWILHRQTHANRRRHRFFDQINLTSTGVSG